MTTVQRVTIESSLLIATLSGLVVAAIGVDTSLRSADALAYARLCGVELEARAMRFERHPGPDGPTSVSWDGKATDSPVVMRFDEPTAHVDFLAATPTGHGTLEAELIAFDARGRVLDVDRGPAMAGETITLQVTAESAAIQEAHLRVRGLAAHDVLTLSQIDAGAGSDYCPLRAAS